MIDLNFLILNTLDNIKRGSLKAQAAFVLISDLKKKVDKEPDSEELLKKLEDAKTLLRRKGEGSGENQ